MSSAYIEMGIPHIFCIRCQRWDTVALYFQKAVIYLLPKEALWL